MENITYKEFIQNILDTRGRFACGDRYHERHHILPKCIGGGNEEENLVDLFSKEHFIAHKLLCLENPDNRKLLSAWWRMCNWQDRNKEFYEPTPEEYEEARIAFVKSRTGENNPMYGKHLSDETKKKMSDSRKGKYTGEDNHMYGQHLSEEAKKRISEANTGRIVSESARQAVSKANASRVWSEESKQKLSNTISGENHPWFGRHHTEETRRKISEIHKGLQTGEKNPRALIMIQFDKEDNLIKVWRYAKLASKELKIHYGDISRCANGFLKSAGGFHWKYLYDNKLRSGETIFGVITLGIITEEEALKLLEEDKMIN